MSKIRLWGEGGIIRMADDKLQFSAFGVFNLGCNLIRLEWAINTISNPSQIAPFFEKLRICEQVQSFEDIGLEAKHWHDKLSELNDQQFTEAIRNDLRAAKARWHALATERLQDLFLVAPTCLTDPKHLMRGIEGLLSNECISLLGETELLDLNEACRCILVSSATAAEHMALRATESLLRRWYEHKTGNKLRRVTWGTVLNKLVKEYPEKNRPKEIALLGYLKQRRDEVAHPERVSSIADAEATLMNVCSLFVGIGTALVESSPPISSDSVDTLSNE